jgi:tetratricopeptide (TPR) repeat protein
MFRSPTLLILLLLSFSACSPRGVTRNEARDRAKVEASRLVASGDYERAIRILEPLASGGKDAAVFSLLAESLWKTGDFTRALGYFESSLRLDYMNYETHMNLALMLMERGKKGRALTEFKLAARYGSHEALPHYNYGLALYQMGRREQALAEWRKAFTLDSSDPRYAAAMGMILSGEDDGEALGFFEKAAALGADSPAFHHNFGLLLERMGEVKRATEHFEAAYEKEPTKLDYASSLAGAYLKTHRYEDAIPILESMIRSGGAGDAYAIPLGKAYLETDRPADAIGALEGPTRKWLDDPSSFGGEEIGVRLDRACEILAMSYWKVGDAEKALFYYEKALELDPENVNYLINYGTILAESGKIEKAAEQWRKVLSLDPGNVQARKNLGAVRKSVPGNEDKRNR